MRSLTRIIFPVSALALLAPFAVAHWAAAAGAAAVFPQPEAAKPAAKGDKAPGDPYTLATCPTSSKKLGTMGDPIVKTYEGGEVRFCCGMCPPKFEKDLAKSFAALDETITKDQLPLYPVDTSIVSGTKLGDKPVDWVYNNRLVRLASAGEKAEFLKDPAKYLVLLDKAVIQKQSKDYPLKTCLVSKEELGGMGEAKDVVIGGRLIRLCCNDCKKDLAKDPAKFIAVIDAARHPEGGTHEKDAGDHHDHAGSPPSKK